MSFDKRYGCKSDGTMTSQSLSSRAMSFDVALLRAFHHLLSLNPFRSGQCLSTLLSTTINSTESASQSLSIREMSFDLREYPKYVKLGTSQSLSIRAMSFDFVHKDMHKAPVVSQSLSIRAMSFDFCSEKKTEIMNKSQSLSSRAMSFDAIPPLVYYRRFMSQSLSSRAMSFDRTTSGRTTESNVSIPFDQGNVFRHYNFQQIKGKQTSLNPFRSGQCLSTAPKEADATFVSQVSIPFDQGNVFRQ